MKIKTIFFWYCAFSKIILSVFSVLKLRKWRVNKRVSGLWREDVKGTLLSAVLTIGVDIQTPKTHTHTVIAVVWRVDIFVVSSAISVDRVVDIDIVTILQFALAFVSRTTQHSHMLSLRNSVALMDE